MIWVFFMSLHQLLPRIFLDIYSIRPPFRIFLFRHFPPLEENSSHDFHFTFHKILYLFSAYLLYDPSNFPYSSFQYICEYVCVAIFISLITNTSKHAHQYLTP